MPPRMIVAASIAGVLLAGAVCVPAQDYPTKAVRVITGSAGGVVDIVTRQIGQQLSEKWGQPVVVENRGGAGLTIGTAAAAKAVPNGYTLLLSDRTAIAVAPTLHKSLPYVPLKDLAPITLATVNPGLLVTHPSFPAANLREFIDHARRHPGMVNMAISGPGTANHIATELFKSLTGTKVVTVPYRGGAATIMGIVSGETKAGFSGIPTALPHVLSGKLKAYAISGKTRFSGASDIPTFAQAGLPGFESDYYYWVGLFAPAGTPPPLVSRLNRDIVEILQAPATKTALLVQGAEPSPTTPAEFAAFVKNETASMKTVIELAAIKPE